MTYVSLGFVSTQTSLYERFSFMCFQLGFPLCSSGGSLFHEAPEVLKGDIFLCSANQICILGAQVIIF